jgi:predicted nucleic acid-binding protein
MNGMFEFDTCSCIKHINREDGYIDLDRQFLGHERFVSVITRMELLGYPAITDDEEKRINDFLSKITVVPLDGVIETVAIQIRRKTSLKLPDAIIAATAVVLGAQVVSTDGHFLNCKYPGLNVWK